MPSKPISRIAQTLLVLTILIAGIYPARSARAADEIPGEDMFPDDSFITVVIPNVNSVKAQFEKTRMAGMFAQPMMKEFFQPVLDAMQKLDAATHKANPEAFTLTPALTDGSLAAAIYGKPGNPQSFGMFVVFTPRSPEDFLAACPKTYADDLRDVKLMDKINANNDIYFAWTKNRLIACMPKMGIPPVVARLQAGDKSLFSQSPGYVKARAQFAGSAGWIYAAPQALNAMAAAEFKNPPDLAAFKSILSVLGLDKLDSIGLGFGFHEGEIVADAFAGLSAQPDSGLFTLFNPGEAASVPAAAFKIAAPESPYVGAGYFNFAGVIPLLRNSIQAADPKGVGQFDMLLQLAGQTVKLDPQKDFFENIDGHFLVAQTPANTALAGMLLPGMVYSFGAKNPAKLEECLAKAGQFVDALPPPLAGKLKLKKIDHENKSIYYLSGPFIPLSPSLCVTEGRLLAGTSLNAVRRTLEQLQKPGNILSNKDFQQTLARVTGAPFNPDKIPCGFDYGMDQGGGHGAMLLALGSLSASTLFLAGNAALPAPAGVNLDLDIAKNESKAIASCISYAEAQEIYHRTDYDEDGVLEYAQTLKGEHSLLENHMGKADLGLVTREFANAEGNPDGKTSSNGYRFKILTSAIEKGGKKTYLVKGNMVLGYALLAYPVQPGVSGKRCFMINNTGTVFSTDWGAQTAEKAKACESFDNHDWLEVDVAGDALTPEKTGEKIGAEMATKIMHETNLGLWPDEAFFTPYERPTAATLTFGPAGIRWHTELPPPMPRSPSMGSAPVIIAVVAIGAGLTLPVLARARESARRTSSASNMHQMGIAAFMYADVPANGKRLPTDPLALVPAYIADPKVFSNPRFPGQDIGYTWVGGVTTEMPAAILAFEAPALTDHSGGRNVLYVNGTVMWVEDGTFENELAATEASIKKAKGEMKLVPVSFQDAMTIRTGKAKPQQDF